MTADPAAMRRTPTHWILRMLAWAFGLAGAGTLALLMVVGLAMAVAYANLPQVGSLTDYQPKLPMRIHTADGVLIGEFGEERRNFTRIEDIPKVMRDAVLAAEDARFYEHGGVDFKGIARAALENLRDARSQGASTITMQVARNFYLSTEKTFTRKIYEILLAMQIESQLSKDKILELYMNQIFLGKRANGFASAAEIYFGKALADISVAEAAMLAGLPKAPAAYNPFVNPRRATIRQRYIIDRMLANGFIDETQAAQAREQPLVYRKPAPGTGHAEFVAETARQLVYAQYGDEAYTRGLEVHLSIDSRLQEVAYAALRRGLMDYELRQYYRGPEAFIDLPADPALLDARVVEALADHPDNGDLRSAVVLEAGPSKVSVMLQDGRTLTITGAGLQPVRSGLSSKAGPKIAIRRGAVVRVVEQGARRWALTQLPQVEGAVVAMDPRSGAIKALVGGFDYGHNKFNHATQAWRQPGSSFKPFVYSAALQKGFTAATVINDAPLFFAAEDTGSEPWEPKNYDGEFDGPMTLGAALAKSKNMVSIRVLQSISPSFAQDWVRRFGFAPDKHPAYLTMALGAGSVTPLQLASAYSVFANGGHLLPPGLITRITDSQGQVLREMAPVALGDSTRSLDERNSFVMGSLLQEVTRSGTASNAQRVLQRPDLYGKTGTTNDSLDAWFAGYHPSLVGVVWIGYDNPRKLGSRETGGGLALPVWIELMQHALKDAPVELPEPPEGLVNIDGQWMFEEFSQGAGVRSVGLEDSVPPPAPTQEERRSILDLFRR